MALWKTVFHVHTDYSDDSDNAVTHLAAEAERQGVDCLAVTDHDTLDGALALAELAGEDLRVIVGEEISTRQGHLVGLFLTEPIPPDMEVRATAEAIKDQGGLVIVPHPFNLLFDCGLRSAVRQILDLIDAVEVSNAQNLSPLPNVLAARFARNHGLPGLVGVDSHHRNSLAACYQWMRPFDGPADFLAAARDAQLVFGCHRPSYFARSAVVLARKWLRIGAPPRYGRHCTVQRGRHRGQPVRASTHS